jgi:hypothetical protein
MAKKAIDSRWTNELMGPNYTDPVKRMRDGQYGESTNNVSLVNKSRHFWREFFFWVPPLKLLASFISLLFQILEISYFSSISLLFLSLIKSIKPNKV